MDSRYFLIYRSSSHSYLCFVLMALPLFCFWLAVETGFAFLCAVAAILLLLCLGFLIPLCSLLRIDNTGVRLVRLVGKRFFLPWEEIRYHGMLHISYYGSPTAAEIFYVSRKPLPRGITAQGTLPKLTEDFLFASIQPGLAEALTQYLPK